MAPAAQQQNLMVIKNLWKQHTIIIQDSKDFIQKIKHLSINPKEETLVSFDVSTLFTSISVPVALHITISKFLLAPILPMSARPLQKKITILLEFTISNCIFCFNKKFYIQLQGAAICSPVSPVIVSIYLEHFESIAISTSPILIKWWLTYVDDDHSATGKDQVYKLQECLNSIDPHIKFTIEFWGTDGLPFPDTLTKPTPNYIESSLQKNHPHW